MHLFYTPDIAGNAYTFSEEESKHAGRVLRLSAGDFVQLIDGKGTLYEARINDTHPKRCSVEIVSKIEEYGKRSYTLHLAVAPTKNTDRFEWLLEKATEIGVDTITPIICQRSERRELRIDRLEKIITAAVKQSLTAYHPKLNEAMDFQTFLKQKPIGKAFIAHCLAKPKPLLQHVFPKNEPICICIGPEGDFSETEIGQAEQAGFASVSLGTSRLRTETAAVAVCLTAAFVNQPSSS